MGFLKIHLVYVLVEKTDFKTFKNFKPLVMNSSKNSKQKLIAGAAIVILALLGVNAYLLYNGSQKDTLITQQTAEIDEAEKLKTELEKQYYEGTF